MTMNAQEKMEARIIKSRHNVSKSLRKGIDETLTVIWTSRMSEEEPREDSSRHDDDSQNTEGNAYRYDHRAHRLVAVVRHRERREQVTSFTCTGLKEG